MTETIDSRLIRIIDELLGVGIPLKDAMTQFELKYVKRAITRAKGNITQASRGLGVHRNTIHGKLRTLEGPTRRAVHDRALRERRRRQGRG